MSPVLDTACLLLVVDLEGQDIRDRQELAIPQANLLQRADFISNTGIDMLVCGAISQHLEQLLMAQGIQIRPWTRGCVDRVLEAVAAGGLNADPFRLPGCRRGGGRGQSGGGGRGGRRGSRPTEDL